MAAVMTGPKKAAILLLSLGEEAAGEVMKSGSGVPRHEAIPPVARAGTLEGAHSHRGDSARGAVSRITWLQVVKR